MINETIISLAQQLWDYHHMPHSLQPVDCILTFGSQDTRVAERAAALYQEGWASLLIFSGGLGRLTQGEWQETEAEKFSNIAIERGVPKEAILLENRSTNT